MALRPLTRSCCKLASSVTIPLARTFIPLAPRRFYNATTPPTHEFIPSPPPQRFPKINISTTPQEPANHASASSTSPTSPGTRTIYNPQKDEKGNPMEINITSRASKRLKQIMDADTNPNFALRFIVKPGGCHGFEYQIQHTTLPEISSSTPPQSQDSSLQPDDVVFMASDGSEAKVVIDTASLELLNGSDVDFTSELIGSMFKINNPLATSTCGCGTSFDVKAE